MMPDEHKVHVHVDNFDDFQVTRTEEHEPEHFIAHTFVLVLPETGQVAGEGQQHVLDILELDPLRKEAAIQSLDNTIVICHSKSQALSQANQVAGLPSPDGIPLVLNQTLSVTGTGALWACATVAGSSRVAVITNRRGRA